MPHNAAARLRHAGVTVLLGLLGAAAASPATDLFQAATDQVRRDYYGWATGSLDDLIPRFAGQLSERCAAQTDTCSFETGRAVLTDLFSAFGDAHTNVRDPEGALRLQEQQQNRPVPRTGARVVRVEGGLLVVSVMPGSPASEAGVRVFDLLTSVNGEAAGKRAGQNAPVGPNEFIRLERTAQPVQVTLRRPGTAELTLSLGTRPLQARDEPTLTWTGVDRRTALITYPTFLPRDASELFLKRVQEAQAGGAQALIVDLRYNGGGSLSECVAAASVFTPVEYRTQYRTGSAIYAGLEGQEVRPQSRRPAPDRAVWHGPAAVLVGPNTASCAEVFTFYAQRAGVPAVGESTKGVGNSGVIFQPLPDGGVVSVTILRAFGPDGQPLPDRVQPDVLAPTDLNALMTEGRDTTLEAALITVSQVQGPRLPARP
ncbi:peptidase S41 [Deinococcus taeanensis]|uniref:S41 family peptidase n=1 Tax=Deinococcus taeanensis TaxID=2737050 RepID=UPI001CDCDC31|nr:S41 family peptidase [Deinococcus taeanensis]UBV41736.1 peptidase S41 [Deinococcus taeanensis]